MLRVILLLLIIFTSNIFVPNLYASFPIINKNIVKKAIPKKASLIIDCTNLKKNPKVLYQDDANEIRHPASLTKIMTVYLLLEAVQSKKIKLSTRFRVSKFATQQMPSKLNLKEGETISVLDCIKALLVKSANDVAVVVAEGLAGSVSSFCKMMNRKARSLGMRKTHYENPSGVPNIKQITCANDIAILGLSIINKFHKYWHLFSIKNFTYKNKTYGTHCKILRWYNGSDGGKTGYICASGFNLWVTAVRFNKEGKQKRLCAIIFGGKSAKERDFSAARLLDKYFGDYNLTNNKLINNNKEKIILKSKPLCDKINKNNMNNKRLQQVIQKADKINNKYISSKIPQKLLNKSQSKNIDLENKIQYNKIQDKKQQNKIQDNKQYIKIQNKKQQNKIQDSKQYNKSQNNEQIHKLQHNDESVVYELESFPMDDIIKSTGKSKEYFDNLYKDEEKLIQIESSTPIDFSKTNNNNKKKINVKQSRMKHLNNKNVIMNNKKIIKKNKQINQNRNKSNKLKCNKAYKKIK